MSRRLLSLGFCLFAVLAQSLLAGTRIKDFASIEGVRDNQLIGYGVVVGLNQTGDRRQTVFSTQTLTNMLQKMGVQISPTSIRVNNTASVMVTATLPPFAQPGTKVDLTVAAIGDASNLQGGLLLITNLRSADGQPYAMGQGAVVTGGFVAGGGGTKQTTNHPTVGRVPNGGTVEKAPPSVSPKTEIKLQLHRSDFSSANRVTEAINKKFGGEDVAVSENSGLVRVKIPAAFISNPVSFIAQLETIQVETDAVSKVVINERTGTIIMGKQVKVSPVAIMHGNLSIQIETTMEVSQPAPFSQGQTQVVPQTGVGVKEEKARNLMLKDGATVEELVKGLSAIGSTARDIIAILQSLQAAGALEAEIEVI
ncbi:flagellar basal body P-ring protein FlgI [Paludibaculum fermentans]|uniref:Flagellar P-ring protein n=1 Tax=Paludibaculum fermentans TaxID=1473598 RepID=A0A7S7NS64_PALFE|nr:flagellar basal body P-ring protein FlgI [Paludibaculum fermentans]QOY88850.1 flagellar basal body P-ring protein FlgI [Paludibaculum fermentans]